MVAPLWITSVMMLQNVLYSIKILANMITMLVLSQFDLPLPFYWQEVLDWVVLHASLHLRMVAASLVPCLQEQGS